MKQSIIEKAIDSQEITTAQLEAIGSYTRRKMKPEELFVFSILLCDNEVDRDNERFPRNALEKLAELFLGKTGVFDHLPKAENQSARIFKTQVVKGEEKNSLGKDYYSLRAWAYMVKASRNLDLILEIDAGIKKEVSVGCSVTEIRCSICGNDHKAQPCRHVKGELYNGVKCHYLLEKPVDAYEWSFVAVPAQRNAGVTKRYSTAPQLPDFLTDDFAKVKSGLTLDDNQLAQLENYVGKLSGLAKAGKDYMTQLQKDIVRNASFAQPEMDCQLLEELCGQMTLDQLKGFHKSYQTIANNKEKPFLQLKGSSSDQNKSKQTEFKI